MSDGIRNTKIQDVVDSLSKKMCGHTQEEARKLSVCTTCGGKVDVDAFADEISEQEYKISGMCENCQDEVFA